MQKVVLFQSIILALALAAPTKKPAGYTGRRPHHPNQQRSNTFGKRDCDTYPSGPDPDVLTTVYKIAKSRNVTDRVMLATFETCDVESFCNNLPCGNLHSVGVFQQQWDQGWGTIDQLMNVTYSTNAFLDQCVKIDAQQPADVTAGVIAQMVQQSENPDAYQKAESQAKDLLAQAQKLAGDSSSDNSTPPPTNPPATAATASSTDSSESPSSTPPPSGGAEDDGDCDDDDSGDDDSGDDSEDCDDGSTGTPTGTSSITSPSPPPASGGGQDLNGSCSNKYTVQESDTCDSVAQNAGISTQQLYDLNSDLSTDCSNLNLGQSYCLN